MNKSNLVESINNKVDYLTKKDIEGSINEILSFSSDTLALGSRIEIRGFGTFSTRQRKTRMARNPNTGTSIKVNSKYHPYFRAAKSLKLGLAD
jgi:integration host factor subunit beta